MDVEAEIANLLVVALAYGGFIKTIQMRLTEMVVTALQVESRYKLAVNFGVGLTLALALTIVLALNSGDWKWVGTGLLAGLIASADASIVHDAQKAKTLTSEQEADAAYIEGRRAERQLLVSRRQRPPMDTRRTER